MATAATIVLFTCELLANHEPGTTIEIAASDSLCS